MWQKKRPAFCGQRPQFENYSRTSGFTLDNDAAMGDPETTSLDLGFDIQEAVKQRLALQNKKTVQLTELLRDTKFTKSEIRTMYRGFKQVRTIFAFILRAY